MIEQTQQQRAFRQVLRCFAVVALHCTAGSPCLLLSNSLWQGWAHVIAVSCAFLLTGGLLSHCCCAAEPSVSPGETGKGGRISVNYDGFIDDVSTGDELLVDGGIISFVVKGKTDTDVQVGLAALHAGVG
jgi:hypothetical protein